MEQMLNSTTDVLVVGAGPTGLVLASELLRRGMRCRVIDKRAAYPTSTRGHALQPHTLEVLDMMGIADKMLAVGTAKYTTRFFSSNQLLLELDSVMGQRSDAPYLSALLSRQPRFEGVLRDHFESLGGMVELASELTDLREETDAVVATVNHNAANNIEQIRASYLVGCDGGHSIVRKLLGLTFAGEAAAEHFVLADVEIDWDLDPSPDLAYWYLHEDGMLLAATYGNAPTWGLFAQISANAAGEVEPASEELFSRLIAERTGKQNVHLTKVSWLSNYSINRRMVNHYRHGRAFVAGDAAHIHSPSGGQGMNTGIQDAFNLAWKLALVLNGKAAETLLDSYEEERLPVAKAVLSGTGSMDSGLFSQTPVMTFAREHIAAPLLKQPAIREMIFYRLAQLNVNYRGASLAQNYELPLGQITLLPTNQSETPHLKDWFDFRSAPHAGDRAPQAHGQRYPSHTATSLFEEFRSGKFTLLLFGGIAYADEGYANLVSFAQRVTGLLSDEIAPYLVIARNDKPHGLNWEGCVLLDPTHEIHQTYGAGTQSLYLIRPDGYVGFRAQPIDEGPLLEYLGRVFLLKEPVGTAR